MNVPILSVLRNYSWSYLGRDVLTGLTVGVILIPQAIAYAYLAGVPAVYGLYSALIPCVIYALWGGVRQLSIGPVALSAMLLYSGLSMVAEPFSMAYVQLAIVITFWVGVFQWAFGVMKLGFFANFLSQPVISGFASGASIIIIVSQLKSALGVTIGSSVFPIVKVWALLTAVVDTNLWSLVVFLVAALIIGLLRKVHRMIPSQLIVVVLGIIVCSIFPTWAKNIELIGAVESGLPSFSWQGLQWDQLPRLLPTILTLSIIGVVECITIAKTMQRRAGGRELDINRELVAVGNSKLVSSLFQAFPTSASFSRSALAADLNSASVIHNFFSALLVLVSLLFLTDFLPNLPIPILAAIIVMSVYKLFDYSEARRLWYLHRSDFYMWLATMVGTLLLGIEKGLLIGVLLSILVIVWRSMRPHMAVLGNLPKTTHYRNVKRYQNAIAIDNILIVRFDDQLYYANSAFFYQRMKQFFEEAKSPLSYIVLDAGNIHAIDSTGIDTLRSLIGWLYERDAELHFCHAIGPVRDMLAKSGMTKDGDYHHLNVHDAVQFLQKKQSNRDAKNAMAKSATQANV